MSHKTYAYVGNWGFAPAPKGISSYLYDEETGNLELIETIRPDIAAGQLCLDEENLILYASNECGDREGEIGGGGYIYAFRIDPDTGKLTLINQQDSLCCEPSYLCLTKSKKYLIVCYCADPWHVTKLVRHEDGSIGNEVLFDDTALLLFPIEADGSIGAPCDYMLMEGTGGKGENSRHGVDPVTGHIQLVEVISRLHAVYMSPDGSFFITLDKGMDKIITFKVDEEAGRLVMLQEYTVDEVASFPRYGAFHPTKKLFYANNENLALLNTFAYDDDGCLTLVNKLNLYEEDPGLVNGKPVGAQDILCSPDGKTLYVTVCGLNDIIVMSLDEDGIPSLKQHINSEGDLPRGIALSPDGKYLISGNMESNDITVFRVLEDGTLEYTGNKIEAVSPSAIRFLTV